jgi:epoxide hydrolase-like predicted phosphatase
MAPDEPADGARPAGLIVDWGGVMTTNLFDSFAAFCEAEGIDRDALVSAFRSNPEAQTLLFAFEEGRMDEVDFEPQLAHLLGIPARHDGLIGRLFAGSALDEPMVDAVRAARSAGIRTGLISNSWGTNSYPRPLLTELFDGMVISGEVGIRKPTTRIYELGAEAIGLHPRECVFVDDLPFNLPPAAELGMRTIRHREAGDTIAQLQDLFALSLGA